MRRISLILLICSSILSVRAQGPNVLFILADDLGINALGCYGNQIVETPNIDRLAEAGMCFMNGYSNDPTCAPSRAAIMTGQTAPRTQIYRVVDRYRISANAEDMREHMRYLPPSSNHLYSEDSGLDPKAFNMARAFRQSGYRTAAYGKWHLGKGSSGMHNMGFDHAIETRNHYGFESYPRQSDHDSLVYNADYCTDKGIRFMTECVKEDKPFFLYMPYFLVHAPFDPKEVYVRHFKQKLEGSEYDHARVIDVLAMIKALDDSVGELLKALKTLGIDDNTIVVFTSDNGHYRVRENNMFALPYRGNKGDIWEGGIRIPYIFRWHGHIDAGTRSETPIIHVDLLPTLAELLDLQMDENHILDGLSLAAVLRGSSAPGRELPLVWFYTNYSGFNSDTKKFQSKWANVIQVGNHKLIEDVETHGYELYDLALDPTETTDISAREPGITRHMIKQLEAAKEQTGLPLPQKNPEYRGQ